MLENDFRCLELRLTAISILLFVVAFSLFDVLSYEMDHVLKTKPSVVFYIIRQHNSSQNRVSVRKQ